jgi:hypothetical protein
MTKTTPRRRRAGKPADKRDDAYFAARIRKLIADLIEGDGPYLRRGTPKGGDRDFTARIRQIIADAEGTQ